jgi:hypothetical protein
MWHEKSVLKDRGVALAWSAHAIFDLLDIELRKPGDSVRIR